MKFSFGETTGGNKDSRFDYTWYYMAKYRNKIPNGFVQIPLAFETCDY